MYTRLIHPETGEEVLTTETGVKAHLELGFKEVPAQPKAPKKPKAQKEPAEEESQEEA